VKTFILIAEMKNKGGCSFRVPVIFFFLHFLHFINKILPLGSCSSYGHNWRRHFYNDTIRHSDFYNI